MRIFSNLTISNINRSNYFLMIPIALLGFISGLPFTLTASILSAYLADNGVDLVSIGILSIVTLPYTLKALWAPIIDVIKIPYLENKLNRRVALLVVLQILMAITILLFSNLDLKNSSIGLVTVLAISIAFLSATQDMVIDAYRIELIPDNLQGIAISVYTLFYRIGLITSSAGMLYLAHFISWKFAYTFIATIVFICAILTIFLPLVNVIKKPKTNSKITYKIFDTYWHPIKDLFKRSYSIPIIIIIIFFKFSDAFIGMMTMPFLIEIGFSKIEIAQIVKLFGFFATILGSFFGGFLYKKFNVLLLLLISCFLQMVSNLLFIWQANVGYDLSVLSIIISTENFMGGFGTAIFVGYLSSLCNKNFTTTQYAILSSAASVSRVIFSSLSGKMVNVLGWVDFFIFSATLSLPALVCIIYIMLKINKTNRG